jgi:lipopolysaccharide transport system permease protein
MSGVVAGFRWCLIGKPTPGPILALSAACTLVLLVTGLLYFRRVERTFADQL